MKRWAAVTIALYGLTLLALTIPGFFAASASYEKATGWTVSGSLADARQIFGEWGYWLWFGLLLITQALLLLVPVRQAERRLPSRRALATPVIVGSFLLANLLFAGAFALLAAVFGDKFSVAFELPAEVAIQAVQKAPPVGTVLASMGIAPANQEEFFCITTALAYLLILWIAWGLVFLHYARSDQPDDLTRRATRWLLRGSILDLLVAIPSHIIIRHRNDCCAPATSFWGIVTGISVMLMAFGPGVFFLFVRRARHARPNAHRPSGPP